MFLKKLLIVLMSIVVAVQPFMNMGCTEKSTEPLSGVQNQEPAQDPEIMAMEQQAQLYEAVIAKMDKYVTTNSDGTYTLDYQGFLNANQLAGDEMKIADALNKGVPVVNAQVLQEQKDKGSTALGSACWYYWWGKRCCYWGSAAWVVLGALIAGSGIAGFNIILVGFSVWADYLLSTYGGFCLNVSWAGGAWLTKP